MAAERESVRGNSLNKRGKDLFCKTKHVLLVMALKPLREKREKKECCFKKLVYSGALSGSNYSLGLGMCARLCVCVYVCVCVCVCARAHARILGWGITWPLKQVSSLAASRVNRWTQFSEQS